MTDELDIFSDVPAHVAGSENALVLSVHSGSDRLFADDGQLCVSLAGHVRSLGDTADVVIVGAAPDTSRAYYKGDELRCYSANGVQPLVKEPQAPSCRSCPQNQAGSRIANGRKSKACGYFHRFAVLLAGEMDAVYALDVRTTSLFGTSVQRAGAYSMKGYTEFLQRKGVGVEKLVTRISLDKDVSYAKMLFSTARFVTPEEQLKIQEFIGSEVVSSTLDIEFDVGEAPQESAPSSAGLFITT